MKTTPKNLAFQFFGKTANTYEFVATFATFGKDNYWKSKIIKLIEKGESILDLACGTGKLTRVIAKKFPQSEIIGLDISKPYLAIAQKNSLSNISFIYQDAEKLDLTQRFDCICSSYLAKYCTPKILVERCINHLKPGGTLIFHDFSYPANKAVKKFWKFHFLLLGFIGNFIPYWKYAFLELPKLIQESNWVEQYIQELENNGLKVTQLNLTWNTSVILLARKNT